MDAEAMVRPVVEGAGLELVEVVLDGRGDRRVLRVTVDADTTPDVAALSALSEKVARRLDLQGFDLRKYALEVSSPGIEHPLRTPGQFRRAVGEQVRVKLTAGTSVEGALVAADEEALVLASSGGERRVLLSDVASVRTVADWDSELRRAER